MCGIAGFFRENKNDNKLIIEKMLDRIVHRGPDSSGIFVDENSGMTLGHRRLAIVDLTAGGHQPFESADKRYIITFNGEIYNKDELAEYLIEEGHVAGFKGTSDTEVLTEMISFLGVKETCVRLTGMWAFAAFDRKERKLYLSRDRIGEKPLYYGYSGRDMIFASELSALMAFPDIKLQISQEAVKQFLRYSYIPAPLSVFEGIYKLCPGHILSFTYPYDRPEDIIYYDLTAQYNAAVKNKFTGSFTEAAEELDKVLKNAVKSQTMADVALGSFLSGGIDSAIVTSMLQSVSSGSVKTFTIGFEDKSFDESEAAGDIAEYLGTDHTSLIVSEKQLQEVVPLLPDIFSEPMADSSQIPTYLVSKLAKEQVTVSLSGDAGDELFGGYNTYGKVCDLYNKVRKVPRGLCNAAGKMLCRSDNNTLYRSGSCLLYNDIANFHEAVCYDDVAILKNHINQKPLLAVKTEGESVKENNAALLNEMMLRDLCRYHPEDILVKVDRAGMAVSLENRVPMLDKDVLGLAFSLPAEYKLAKENGEWKSKRVLKEVLYKYVPKQLMDRPKKGFSVPLSRWLCSGTIYDMVRAYLRDSHLVRDGIIREEFLDRLLVSFYCRDYIQGSENLSPENFKCNNKHMLWNVFVLEQWYRKYMG